MSIVGSIQAVNDRKTLRTRRETTYTRNENRNVADLQDRGSINIYPGNDQNLRKLPAKADTLWGFTWSSHIVLGKVQNLPSSHDEIITCFPKYSFFVVEKIPSWLNWNNFWAASKETDSISLSLLRVVLNESVFFHFPPFPYFFLHFFPSRNFRFSSWTSANFARRVPFRYFKSFSDFSDIISTFFASFFLSI